jgi:protein TonB
LAGVCSPEIVAWVDDCGAGIDGTRTCGGTESKFNKKSQLKIGKKIATNSDSIKNDIPPVDIKITMCYQVAEDKPLAFDEQMPQFPGGEQELALYIAKNLKYPSVAIENGVEGTVLIRFEINKMGNVAKIQVMESLNPACDKEAIRIVKSLPVFIPGKQNGVRVCVWYTLPVTFKLPQ